MSDRVAVTDPEGRAVLEAAAQEAVQLEVDLVAVNLTAAELDGPPAASDLSYEVVVPEGSADADEVEQVLQVIEARPQVTRLVVGVRERSSIGKAVLGSITSGSSSSRACRCWP